MYPWHYANHQAAIQGQGQAWGQAWGGNAQNQQYNPYAQGVAASNVYPPPPQFEENVPDDELEFEGKLTRWNPYALLAQYSPSMNSKKNHFGIECCQRMLML